MRHVTMTVNGTVHQLDVEPRDLLVYVPRERLGFSGTLLAACAADDTEPSSDTAASAEFRTHLAQVLTHRALVEALAW